MTKKTISLLLALVMAFSLAMPAFATGEAYQTLSDSEVETAVNVAVSALVDAPEDATVIIDGELIDDVSEEADTPKEVASAVSDLIFIEENLAESISSEIVENSKYTIKVIEGDKTTVYCSIDFEEFPEIFDARVYLLAIEKIQNKCDEVAIENGVDVEADSYSAMSYNHIAGELALHMILAKLTKDSASWNPISEWIYERAGVADLNVDENRVPSFLITSFGQFIASIMEIVALLFG